MPYNIKCVLDAAIHTTKAGHLFGERRVKKRREEMIRKEVKGMI